MRTLVNLLKPIGMLVSYIHYKLDRLRLAKLIQNGLKVGKNVYIMEDVEFDRGYPYLIEIGDNCRIGKGVRILAHDATTFRDLGINRLAPVRILEGCFIGERAIILPGVTIGPRTLIAAGSVVNRDIGDDRVAAGNPARPYGSFTELLDRYRVVASTATIFKKEELENGTITTEQVRNTLSKEEVAFTRGVPQRDPYYINADFNEMRSAATRAYAALQQQRNAKSTQLHATQTDTKP